MCPNPNASVCLFGVRLYLGDGLTQGLDLRNIRTSPSSLPLPQSDGDVVHEGLWATFIRCGTKATSLLQSFML